MDNKIFSRRVFNAAVDLVDAWRGARADDKERARLLAAVAALVPEDSAIIIDQGRTERHKNGGGHYLAPIIASRLVDLLRLGLSHREIHRQLNVSKNTVARYEKLHGPFQCPCGRPRLHQGWCSERLKRSPARVAFLRNWVTNQIAAGTYRGRASKRHPIIVDSGVALRNYPYLRGDGGDGAILINTVNDIVPRGFPDHIRADICQDILLEILEGNATIEDLKNGTALAIRKYYKLHPGKFGPLSLDATIPGTEGLRLVDVLPSDTPHF